MGTALGIDVGATLTKLAYDAGGDTSPSFELLPTRDLKAVVARVTDRAPDCLGATGGGAARLAEATGRPVAQVNEFAAWAGGAGRLLREAEGGAPTRFLVVSLGTGTSVLLVDGLAATRVGGTALGGGTLIGLGAALTGCADFDELCALAQKGDSRRVDLLVSDIYRPGEIALAGDLTAASFGRLAHSVARDGAHAGDGPRGEQERADLAASLMKMVGENIGLICGGLSAAAQVTKLALGGSTLRGNPSLFRALHDVTTAFGRETTLLRDGEFAGALGALELARARL